MPTEFYLVCSTKKKNNNKKFNHKNKHTQSGWKDNEQDLPVMWKEKKARKKHTQQINRTEEGDQKAINRIAMIEHAVEELYILFVFYYSICKMWVNANRFSTAHSETKNEEKYKEIETRFSYSWHPV